MIEKLKTVLLLDCGAMVCSAALLEYVDGSFRLLGQGTSATTINPPDNDVTAGASAAVRAIEVTTGRKLLNESGVPGGGVDLCLISSAMGGGLQMQVAGLVRIMTAESAERAALGAGAMVMDVLAIDDGRLPHEKIQRLRDLSPDMILLSGGIDGGNCEYVLELARQVREAGLRPELPVIYAGNVDAQDRVGQILAGKARLFYVDNVRPVLEKEVLEPAAREIHRRFMEHVVSTAPGFDRLARWSEHSILPTTAALGALVERIARSEGSDVLAVSIGEATTDVFSQFGDRFTRTVSGDLGLGSSASNVLLEVGFANVARWLGTAIDESGLRNRLRNRSLGLRRQDDLMEEQANDRALAKEAMRLAVEQHKSSVVGLRGVRRQRDISQVFDQSSSAESLYQTLSLGLIIGSGVVFVDSATPLEAAQMLLDSIRPEGITHLAIDSSSLAPHLGMLSMYYPQEAQQVFMDEVLLHLVAVVAPAGDVELGKPCLTIEVRDSQGNAMQLEVSGGEVRLLQPAKGNCAVTVRPAPGVDVGWGKGKAYSGQLFAGEIGIIVDCRGAGVLSNESAKLSSGAKCTPRRLPSLAADGDVLLKSLRRLPVAGEVLVSEGSTVRGVDLVAMAEVPGYPVPVNSAFHLGIEPTDLPRYVTRQLNEEVQAGDVIARRRTFLGLSEEVSRSPIAGTVESWSDRTGVVVIRSKPIRIECRGHLAGKVSKVIPGQGCWIEARGTRIEGVFGIGGERSGPLVMAVESPDSLVEERHITPDMKGCIVVGGADVTMEALCKARNTGIAGLIVGCMDDILMSRFLGHEIGLVVTGQEQLDFTLIITEGFGQGPMSKEVFALLTTAQGREAAIDGKTHIRAETVRPEILIAVESNYME